jgi:hypothetical protein
VEACVLHTHRPSSLLIASDLLRSPPISSDLLPSPPISSHLIRSPPISSHLLPSPPISSHILPYPPISSHLLPSPPISSHPPNFAGGHGPVQVEFTAAAAATLHLDPQTYANKNVTIEYWQGPIVRPTDLPPSVTVLASYRTEIHSLSPNTTTGTMVNTPAMTSASYGKGRVFLNSPHPEIPSETPAEGTSAEGTHGGTYHKTRPEIYEGELAWVIRMDA